MISGVFGPSRTCQVEDEFGALGRQRREVVDVPGREGERLLGLLLRDPREYLPPLGGGVVVGQATRDLTPGGDSRGYHWPRASPPIAPGFLAPVEPQLHQENTLWILCDYESSTRFGETAEGSTCFGALPSASITRKPTEVLRARRLARGIASTTPAPQKIRQLKFSQRFSGKVV